MSGSRSSTPKVASFAERVLAIVRAIPPGRVLAYGEVATAAGSPRAARAVGTVLKALAPGTDVPWQRVVNARMQISFKGDTVRAPLQRRLLEGEGVAFDGPTIRAEHRWDLAEAPHFLDRPVAPWEPPADWDDVD